MSTKTDPTWKDVDEIVNLRTTAGVKVSLAELEKALVAGENGKVKTLLAGLQNKTSDYDADVYPFGGVRLTLEIQRQRVEKWHEQGVLITSIYTQAISKQKERKTSAAAAAAASTAAPSSTASTKSKAKKGKSAPSALSTPSVSVDEVDEKGSSKPSQPKKKADDSRQKTANIADQIKFDRLQPTESLKAYVPELDENYYFPAWTVEFNKMVDNGINCWLYGGTGAGKSSLVEQLCAIGQLPLIYQSFHEDLKPDQLKGGLKLVDGNTVWVDGPVTKAYREGFVLLLDEFDAFPPEVQFCLFAILDRKPLILEENENEVVQPHPNFRVVATGNTQGRGDESGMYAGTNVLNRALLNRIGPWFKVDYPSEVVYKTIIMKEGVRREVAEVMARLAKEINAGAMNGTLTETFSLRDARRISSVAELLDGDMARALQLCLLNRLSTMERGVVEEMFRRLVPSNM